MSKQNIEPDEIEEESHIITERIIEEPSDEENEGLFEEYAIKGAAFTLGSTLFLLFATGIFALIIEGETVSILLGLLLALMVIVGILEIIEE